MKRIIVNKPIWSYEDACKFCIETYGVYHKSNEDNFFICCDCAEPIYKEDWEDENLNKCPICEYKWYKDEPVEYSKDEYRYVFNDDEDDDNFYEDEDFIWD